MPAFPSLLPNFLTEFAPKTIANIPLGKVRYQNSAVTIEIIPSVREAAGAAEKKRKGKGQLDRRCFP